MESSTAASIVSHGVVTLCLAFQPRAHGDLLDVVGLAGTVDQIIKVDPLLEFD